MKNAASLKMFAVGAALLAAAVTVGCRAVPGKNSAPDPEEVFRNPPQSAKTGVWWHWMGGNVSKEGIVKDLDWFKETGIGAVRFDLHPGLDNKSGDEIFL